MNYQERLNELYENQKEEWGLLAKNLQGLKSARIREFNFEGFTIKIQFNPSRITSSSAKVDKKSISSRACFLCKENRPGEQERLVYENRYELLCNPYPIFKKHFTISYLEHVPQQIKGYFPDLLKLSRDLPELVVFYNAPKCGASAPDHLHFQAGNHGLMPIEDEVEKLKEQYGIVINAKNLTEITAVDDGLRRFIILESEKPELLESYFNRIFSFASGIEEGSEPMLNILAEYHERWRIFVFLREKHRPWQFFEEGDENILLSPASVDYGGTMITPLEKDFNKISRDDIKDIFHQVSLSKEKFTSLINILKI